MDGDGEEPRKKKKQKNNKTKYSRFFTWLWVEGSKSMSFFHQVILGMGREPATWHGKENGFPTAGFLSPTTMDTDIGGTVQFQ